MHRHSPGQKWPKVGGESLGKFFKVEEDAERMETDCSSKKLGKCDTEKSSGGWNLSAGKLEGNRKNRKPLGKENEDASTRANDEDNKVGLSENPCIVGNSGAIPLQNILPLFVLSTGKDGKTTVKVSLYGDEEPIESLALEHINLSDEQTATQDQHAT